MHASLHQLLNLRDGQPVAAETAQHVAGCVRCGNELTRLAVLRERFGSLPAVASTPAQDDLLWRDIQASLVIAPKPARSPNRYLAIAAALVWVGVALVWFVLAGDSAPPVAGTVATVADSRTEPMPALETLVLQSQQLESMLLTLPRRPRVEQAATAATLDALEQRIQLLDYALSSTSADGLPAEQAEVLWGERVRLLDSLVVLRYVQAERVHF